MSSNRSIAAVIAAVLLGAVATMGPERAPQQAARSLYIVQAADPTLLTRYLAGVDAAADKDLAIIGAVSAHLTASQAQRLRHNPGVRVYADREVRAAGFSLVSRITTELDTTLKYTTNSTNYTLASSAVGTLTSSTTTSVLAPLLGIDTLQSITSPLTRSLSSGATLQDGSGVNALGQGNRANATIGRTLQLIVRNVGGGLPGAIDRATLGNPGKYTFCFAEDESDPDWEPLSVRRGVAIPSSATSAMPSWSCRPSTTRSSRTAAGTAGA